MKMTFGQYIQNPMGKRNAVFTQTEVYRKLYSEKLDKIIVREGGIFNYVLYTDGDDYFIHMKVPSEVIDKFYYDVVVRFYTDEPKVRERRDLDRYYVQFFSNDPAFVYTFAHAFRTNDMFIEVLKEKMSKEAIRKKPKEKNPNQIVGYVKSLFFCFLVMENRSLFNKITYETYGKKLKKKDILNDITHADIKIKNRQDAETDKRKKVQIEKKKIQRKNDRLSRYSDTKTSPVTSAKNTKYAKRTSTVKRTKKR